MLASGTVLHVRSDKDTHFVGSLATNAGESANIVLPAGVGGDGRGRCRMRAMTIVSDQNLAWEILLFAKDTFLTLAADLDLVPFVARWSFTAADAIQVAGTGPYLYYIDGNDQHYEDMDDTGELHAVLVNRSVTAKNAGATGEVVVDFSLEPA